VELQSRQKLVVEAGAVLPQVPQPEDVVLLERHRPAAVESPRHHSSEAWQRGAHPEARWAI
jgi:hypothetical protein